jgi:hypothetical protein
MKHLLIYLLVITGGAAWGQPLLLYEMGNATGKYLFVRTYQEGNEYNVSQAVVADSFAVEDSGAVWQIRMSNAFVYLTKTAARGLTQPSNAVVQLRLFAKELEIRCAKDAKLVFENALMALGDFKQHTAGGRHTVTYEGQALKDEMKRLGLKPPPDADMRSHDVGH